MCLAIPSKVIEIQDSVAIIDVDGVRREASLMLLDDVNIGDYLIVHAGFAINKIDEKAAIETLNELRKLVDSAAGTE